LPTSTAIVAKPPTPIVSTFLSFAVGFALANVLYACGKPSFTRPALSTTTVVTTLFAEAIRVTNALILGIADSSLFTLTANLATTSGPNFPLLLTIGAIVTHRTNSVFKRHRFDHGGRIHVLINEVLLTDTHLLHVGVSFSPSVVLILDTIGSTVRTVLYTLLQR